MKLSRAKRRERAEKEKRRHISETGGHSMPKRMSPPDRTIKTKSAAPLPLGLKDPTSNGWKMIKTDLIFSCPSFHYGHRYYRYGDEVRYRFFFEKL